MKLGLDESPRVRSQVMLQRMLDRGIGTLQREPMPDEEELAQAKFEPVQKQGDSEALREKEEEETLQGRFEPLQRQAMLDEDEMLQGKFEPVQREAMLDEDEALQGKFEPAQREAMLDEDETLQGKFEPVQRQAMLDEDETLQGKFAPVQRRANRTGLPDQLKTGAESLSGLSLDDVRVHYNSPAPATLQAAAYAQGTDIHVAPGQERHVPHEAWHIVQQKQGRVRPTMQAKGVPINDDGGLEREADAMGAEALRAFSQAPAAAAQK